MKSTEQWLSILAIILSGISIIISISNLYWNIYKEIFLRPLSRIRGGIYFTIINGIESEDYVNISILNLGPGKLVINNIVFSEGGLFKKIIGKKRQGVIIQDYTNRLNARFPVTINPYDSMDQYLLLKDAKFLTKQISKIGFCDNLGRYHWIKKKELRDIKKKYNEEYLFSKTIST